MVHCAVMYSKKKQQQITANKEKCQLAEFKSATKLVAITPYV